MCADELPRGITLNVTQQNRAEQKLEESEKRIREINDALPVGFLDHARCVGVFCHSVLG